MTDIILEIVRAFIVGFIFLYLLLTGRREKILAQKGWSYILSGLAVLFFGMIIDITDNFPVLNKYIIIGDTEIQAFLETFVGYLTGFLLLAIGFWKWVPMVIALEKAEKVLENSRDELELRVEDRTAELVAINNELELEIAERYRMENALRESEGKYQSLIANIPSVTWITDSEGNTTFISPNIKEIYGYTPAEICESGESFRFGRVHADDVANVKEAYGGLFEKGGHFDVEYRIKRKDGQWIWLYDRAVTTFEKNGSKYAYGVFTDITRRKRVELELERREEYWRMLIENTMDIITILDSKGIINYTSPSMENVLGYKPEENIDTSAVELVHPDDKAKALEALRRGIAEEGHSELIEIRYCHKDGSWRTMAIKGKSFNDDSGEVKIILNSRDITNRKKAEEERERLIHELQDALAEVKNLSGMLPICSSCKKIRDDKGYWTQVEVYIHKHSDAEFSHGICPECAKALYPKYFKDTY